MSTVTHKGEAMSEAWLSEARRPVSPKEQFISPVLSPEYHPRWYAVYTRPQHEKIVADQLERKSLEAYLPLYEARRRWKDRYKSLTLPLFPGYVFAKFSACERLHVLETFSVVRIVGFNNHDHPLADDEIENLRSCLQNRRAEPCGYLNAGSRVRISAGPLQGLEGVVVRESGKLRFVVSVDCVMRSIAVHVDAKDMESLS